MVTQIIKTPVTDPNHETIGQTFSAWDGQTYICDSWESNLGFWMTRVDAPADRQTDLHSTFRRNVAEHAIGRTFHLVHPKLLKRSLVREK